MAQKINFNPKQVTKRLLAALPKRARDVLSSRYGLGSDAKRMTLESIGRTYGITRERVRQIENHTLNTIRKSDAMQKETHSLALLSHAIDELGGIVLEGDFLHSIAKDAGTRNHIYLLLVLGDEFVRESEDAEFRLRWHIDRELAESVHASLRKLYENLGDDDLVPESEMVERFLDEVKHLNQKYRNEEIARRWLALSKGIAKNPLGEWGRANSPHVRVKGMRDYAYLAIKRHGSPMHFREVARSISELFNRHAHEATCHNELIKDPRFVLVGRGLYALSEWGYTNGVVKDVIRHILEEHGPLSREEVIERVRNERYVKDNTIVVNLQDPSVFRRDNEGRYLLR